jgi:hypothetical protein
MRVRGAITIRFFSSIAPSRVGVDNRLLAGIGFLDIEKVFKILSRKKSPGMNTQALGRTKA